MELEINKKHIFAQFAEKYRLAGYSVIPDKYMGKNPIIKGWSDYCYKQPTKEEMQSWIRNAVESNIAVCLGKASNIIALDVDTENQEIINIIKETLPDSPVEKVGSKGFTRFFRFSGEHTQVLKHNGEVVLEILSGGKKTTIPPSVHPNGLPYVWANKALHQVKAEDLPLLPPFLFSNLQSKIKLKFPNLSVSNCGSKLENGRTLSLGSYAGKLIGEGKSIDEAVKLLIQKDKDEHEIPLFTDPLENQHTEPFTNALAFYTSHLNTANTRHFRENKEYEIPVTASAIDHEVKEKLRLGKLQRAEDEKKSKKRELPSAQGVLKNIQTNILENSFIQQPEFAFSASLALMATVIARKLIFQGMSPNLYVLNIAPSGSGKDMPQQKLKEYLVDINKADLLGAGDYVSDASLVDSLGVKPVRLDIMDEAGGILKSVNSGRNTYDGKMADILAELYTSSTSYYLGRSLAEGTKGNCYRPNVNILASTTPTGFSEGISTKAIEKGLMGRFLVFLGDSHKKARRVKKFTKIDGDTARKIAYWASYQPVSDGAMEINNMAQAVDEVPATDEANKRLDEIFEYFDNMRINAEQSDAKLPIICRLFQQMIKIVLIHAVSRCGTTFPLVNKDDVEFGYQTILYYYDNFCSIVDKYIHDGGQDKLVSKVLALIDDSGGKMSKSELVNKTKWLRKHERNSILEDLIEAEKIIIDREHYKGRNQIVIRSIS